MKKSVIICISVIAYIIVFISLVMLEYHILVNLGNCYINLYSITGKLKSKIENSEIMQELISLNENKSKDIRKISIGGSEPYKYIVTYTYSDGKTYTRELGNPYKYIDYIKNNGYDGEGMFVKYFKPLLYIIIGLIIFAIVLFIFYVIRNIFMNHNYI